MNTFWLPIVMQIFVYQHINKPDINSLGADDRCIWQSIDSLMVYVMTHHLFGAKPMPMATYFQLETDFIGNMIKMQ